MLTAEEVISLQKDAQTITTKITTAKAKAEEKQKQLNEILAKYGCKTIQELTLKREALYKELEAEYNNCANYINQMQPKVAEIESIV